MGHKVLSDIEQDGPLPVYVVVYALLKCLQFVCFRMRLYEIYFI
jgi:hypothetical protein